MRMTRITRWAAVVGLVATFGCKSLDVQNPNAPDAARAFSDPAAVAGLITGGFKNWFNTHEEYNSALVLDAMADSYTASWNNFNLRYYSSYGVECPERCGWDNAPTSALRFQVEYYWYGYYGVLSNANDVLTAIRKNGVVISDQPTTDRTEAAAVLLQAMVFAQIALNYDQGFIVTEETDLSTPEKVQQLEFKPRDELRDAAMAKFDEAIGLLQGQSFTTPTAWFGIIGAQSYSSEQLVRVARTMQAELLAYYPRTSAENGQVNWSQVATYASQGISTGAPFDFGYYQDDPSSPSQQFWSGVKSWGNDITTMRLDTRVAHLITGECKDLAKTVCPPADRVQADPWPDPDGNPQPLAEDARVGDGTWGATDDFLGVGTLQEGAGSGTDFAFASGNIFRPARGQFHQSNLGHIRYNYLAYPGYGRPEFDGTGFVPTYSATMNDLLWAEGLIRGGGDLQTAAQLINKTRVGRGNLDPVSAADGTAGLLTALQYEQDIELAGISAAPFYNRRRIDGLWPMTPRQMPVPAKELQILQRELYTFGGPDNPDAAPGVDGSNAQVRNVRQIFDDMMAYSKLQAKRNRRN